ncbi:hypothetical protein BJ166DRAFT_262712 [Pestalotiopsis sp. NC0098]|nr:hypothetical protein BJ166DRAFT_262712 [Pestalotiopsis sp. NC0098]
MYNPGRQAEADQSCHRSILFDDRARIRGPWVSPGGVESRQSEQTQPAGCTSSRFRPRRNFLVSFLSARSHFSYAIVSMRLTWSRKHTTIKGKWRDTAWYIISADEWPGVHQGFEIWLREDHFDKNGRQFCGLKECRDLGF